MRTSAEAEQILASWFSPAYPVGAFAYSHGLEQALADGAVHDEATAARWIEAVLTRGSGRVDAILLAAAMREGAALDEVSDLALALAAGAEREREMREMGAAFAKVTAEVWGTDPAPRPYAVAVGAAAGALGLPVSSVLRLYLHGYVANLVSAAVRFVPLGQTAGQRITAGMMGAIEEVAAAAQRASLDDIGTSVMAADLASLRHETLNVRIFRT